jgi:hypothetical protein
VPGALFATAAGLYWAFTWPDRISAVSVAKVHKIPPRIYRPSSRPRLAAPRIAGSIDLSGSRDTLFNRLFERSNTSRSCHRPGAKMGSHSAKSRQESGGVWTVICPGKQHFANLLDSSRPARGLLHTEEVTGSIPVSPTQLSGQS